MVLFFRLVMILLNLLVIYLDGKLLDINKEYLERIWFYGVISRYLIFFWLILFNELYFWGILVFNVGKGDNFYLCVSVGVLDNLL